MARITVFTPTFNRAYTLHKCYESLLRQTNKDFEWLIIDDGSTDGTRKLVNSWISQEQIKIKYIKKKNGGMHSGYNTAYDNIFTELAICVDSDDYLLDEALEIILSFWDKRKNKNIAGIIGLNVDKEGEIIGKRLPCIDEIKVYDYYNRYKGVGDKKMVYRPDLMRKFRSPEFEGEKLFPTAYKYFNVDLSHNMLVLNEPLCIIEYMADGFTQNIVKQYKSNLKSFIFYRKFIINYENVTLKHKINASIHYVAESFLAKNRRWQVESPNKLLSLLTLPFGTILFLYLKKNG
jgi:glycosyltransferase involved in cell wall biosynthesis